MAVWISLLIAVILTVVIAAPELYPIGTWHYRMTVSVETPEGVMTGSAVREVHASLGTEVLSASLKGEAVAVELGKRGVLFALMRGVLNDADYGVNIVRKVFPFDADALTPGWIKFYSKLKTSPEVTLEPAQYPMLVRFRDPQDLSTLENVYEMENYRDQGAEGSALQFRVREDRFEEAFGAGVRLKAVTIQMTEEGVTTQIEKYLPHFDAKSAVVSADDFQRK